MVGQGFGAFRCTFAPVELFRIWLWLRLWNLLWLRDSLVLRSHGDVVILGGILDYRGWLESLLGYLLLLGFLEG